MVYDSLVKALGEPDFKLDDRVADAGNVFLDWGLVGVILLVAVFLSRFTFRKKGNRNNRSFGDDVYVRENIG
ncbi:hypothetical protein FACS1894198_6470 [Clostridia bacterium]|nr:hypothetical protein FACS1894198_6470 [Clostridia bacterium]